MLHNITMLRISGFVDDIMFSHNNGPVGQNRARFVELAKLRHRGTKLLSANAGWFG